MKQTLPDRVIYILSFPHATSQDSGIYECSITHETSGEVRVSTVAINVFGKSSLRNVSWIPSMGFSAEAQ